MKRIFILIILFSVPVFTQDTSSKLDTQQCRITARYWLDQILDHHDDVQKLKFNQLMDMDEKILKCSIHDPDGDKLYYNNLLSFSYEERSRLFKFIIRHGYGKQFVNEDSDGIR